MKKHLVVVSVLVVILLLAGCNKYPSNERDESPAPLNTSSSASTSTTCEFTRISDNVLKAWTGEFSEEKLKSIIDTYQEQFSAFVFTDADEAESVTFETDFDAVGCSVTRLSRTDNADMNVELTGYIDLALETTCKDNKVTIPTNWWSQKTIEHSPVWSYLVRVIDADDDAHYYYFRTDYSAFLPASE